MIIWFIFKKKRKFCKKKKIFKKSYKNINKKLLVLTNKLKKQFFWFIIWVTNKKTVIRSFFKNRLSKIKKRLNFNFL